jgi:elongation factor P
MDTATYDQAALDRATVEDALPFMKEGSEVSVLRHQDSVIGIELPITVELAVAQTDPGLRGDTVSGATKPARLETGATLNVPLFINTGDVLKVDTRTGNYLERV